jgi:hypothetical protein
MYNILVRRSRGQWPTSLNDESNYLTTLHLSLTFPAPILISCLVHPHNCGHAAKFATAQTPNSYTTTLPSAPIFHSTAAYTNLSGTVAAISAWLFCTEKMNWYQPTPSAPRPASHQHVTISILDFAVGPPSHIR